MLARHRAMRSAGGPKYRESHDVTSQTLGFSKHSPANGESTESAAERLAGMLKTPVTTRKVHKNHESLTRKRPVSGHCSPKTVQKRCKNKGF